MVRKYTKGPEKKWWKVWEEISESKRYIIQGRKRLREVQNIQLNKISAQGGNHTDPSGIKPSASGQLTQDA